MRDFWPLAVWLGMTAFGGYLAVIYLKDIVLGLMSANWPDTEGVVKYSAVREHPASDEGVYETAEVTYTYWVRGKLYQGKRVSFGLLHRRRDFPQVIVDRYPIRQDIIVTYHPVIPSISVLEPGFEFGCLTLGDYAIAIGFGAFLCIMGSLALMSLIAG